MKPWTLIVGALILWVAAVSCTPSRPAGKPTEKTPPAVVDVKEDVAPPPKPSAVIEQKTTGRDLAGQLDRLDAILTSDDFESNDGSESASYWKDHMKDVDRMREAGHLGDRQVDPRQILNIAAHAYTDAEYFGGLTYGLLLKNADKYASRPWFIIKARILDILEDDELTTARITMDRNRNPLFVVGRFQTNFQEGDLVDVVGFMAGKHTYRSKAGRDITIPALAAAAILRPGSINAMNRIVRVFQGEIPEDQLRNVARKL